MGRCAIEARSDAIASVLSELALDDAGADRIAAVVAANMHAIHLALAPIIGDRGVSALYRRALALHDGGLGIGLARCATGRRAPRHGNGQQRRAEPG